jgi:hypothetical protein
MNGLLLFVFVSLASIGFTTLISFRLDRRAKKNGNLLFHDKQEVVPSQGKNLYFFLAILLLGITLFIWGYAESSQFLKIIAGIVIAGSIVLRFYWTITTLLKESYVITKNNNYFIFGCDYKILCCAIFELT